MRRTLRRGAQVRRTTRNIYINTPHINPNSPHTHSHSPPTPKFGHPPFFLHSTTQSTPYLHHPLISTFFLLLCLMNRIRFLYRCHHLCLFYLLTAFCRSFLCLYWLQKQVVFILLLTFLWVYDIISHGLGVSPSGKAQDFDSCISLVRTQLPLPKI